MIPTEKLSKDEVVMLHALVQSPAFGALRKLVNLAKEAKTNQLIAESNVNQLHVLQGEIRGLNSLITMPQMLSSQAEKIVGREEQPKQELREKPTKVKRN